MNLKEWGERLGFDFYDPHLTSGYFFATAEEFVEAGIDEFNDQKPEEAEALKKVSNLPEEEYEDFWASIHAESKTLLKIRKKYKEDMIKKGLYPYIHFWG